MTRVLLAGATLTGLVLGQVGVLAFLPPLLPYGGPDVVVVAVLALGYAHGPVAGGLAGVWSGLLLDLVPPAAGPFGAWVLVLGLVGVGFGRICESLRPGPFAAMALVASGVGVTVASRGAVLWFGGSPPSWSLLAATAASASISLLLAPVALLVTTSAPPTEMSVLRTTPDRLTQLD